MFRFPDPCTPDRPWRRGEPTTVHPWSEPLFGRSYDRYPEGVVIVRDIVTGYWCPWCGLGEVQRSPEIQDDGDEAPQTPY